MDITTEDILKSITNNNKLPMQTLGMPGPSHVMGLASNIAKAVPGYLSDMHERIKRAVTEGPYSSPTGEYDPTIGTLPWEMMSPGYGRAAGLGVIGGKTSFWTKDKINDLLALEQKYLSEKVRRRGSNKLIYREFAQKYPDYQGNPESLQRQLSRIRTNGGVNLDTGAPSSTDLELGAFGGKGRLNTSSPGEAINRLQEQRPVDLNWIKEWSKDAGVPITKIRGENSPAGATTYVELATPNVKPGQPNVKVRIPGDENVHLGVNFKRNEVGNLFDTGTGVHFPSGDPLKISPHHEARVVNEAGMPYSNPEALEAALKWRLHKARFGGNWLIPEEMAPRLPSPGQPTPPRPYQDPNQLKLLSTGFTPANILKILGQQNGNQ